jgi:hypothetical protein
VAGLTYFMEEPNVIPKELQRDAFGHRRVDRVRFADDLVAQARIMAAAYGADPDRGFEQFADPDCDECGSKVECALHVYEDFLVDAADCYREAGLGLLAERVELIPQRCIVTAWQHFDEANASEEL